MKKANQIFALCVLTALNIGLIAPSAHAAIRTWSGAGADANWNTPANWGGTAPVNGDIVLFSGTTQQNNTNNIANLSVNGLSFANNGFMLNSNGSSGFLALNGPMTNSAGINIIALPMNVTAQNQTWNIAPGSEVRITGQFTNNQTVNPLATMGFGGTVRISSTNCVLNRFYTLTSGSVIADGCVLTTFDGFRVQPPAGSNAVFQVTNNASFTIVSGGNLRLCQTATGGTSRVDVASGILNIATTTGGGAGDIFVGEAASTTTTFNQNGGLVEFTGNGNNRVAFANASVTASGTYNLKGGVLWTKQITQVTAGSPGGTFNFNGGTLKPTTSSTTFFQGVQTANVQAGGAIIDTTNLTITIGQSLGGNGPLTKIGSGTLNLTGANTYTGTTTVSNGTLALTAGSVSFGGGVAVADGAKLIVTNVSSSVTLPSLAMNATTTNTLQFIFPSGNPSAASIVATNLTGTGYVAINVSGSGLTVGTFPLVNFTSVSGLANFHLASITPGIIATLVTNSSSIQLTISSVGKALEWSGAADANWNTTTANWFDLGNGNNPTNYTQPGGFGDLVTFDDGLTANPAVNLALAVSPVTMTLNNNGTVYSFTGSGKITGIGSITKGGFQSVTFGTANDYSGGTTLNAGVIYLGADQALGTGAATLNLGTIASDSVTARTLSNSIVQNANIGVILGDTVNTGTLTLAGGLDFAGGARTLNFNSDVVISGSLTNGGIATKTGPGQLIVTGQGSINAQSTQTGGNTIINGGQVMQTGDGWRMQNLVPGSTMDFAVTNGGSFIMTNLVGGNFRLGLGGEDTSTSYILDVAGKMVVYAPGNPANVGRVYLGIGAVQSTLNLWPGGNLICGQVTAGGTSISEVDLYGGTLTPTFNSTTFFQGMTSAFVQNGGVTVDTTNLTITIAQPLLAAGSGGLTKVGTGTLTLTGTNTYTGTTVVSGGKLVLGPAHAATGGITVNANSTLAFLQSSPPSTVNVPSVTIGSGANSALEAQLSVTNAPAGIITNLILNGSVAVNVTGSFGVGQFPLFGYGTISGAGGLTLGSVPLGTVGHLVTNTPNKTIDLVVSSIAQTIWRGNVSGNWDLATTNWTISGTPVAYAQSANVLFNDSASNSAVNLTTTLTPSTMVVSNNSQSYAFSGGGSLSGNMTLVKDGTNTATLSTANTYTGNTIIKAGNVVMGNSTALGANTATVTVQNGATLDLAGNTPGLQMIVVGGSGTDGNGALINTTTDNNDALRAVTLTTNTIIRADAFLGLRTSAETDPGFIGNGYKLIKTGLNQFNLNGGKTVTNGLTVWDSDLGDIDIQQGTLGIQRRMTMGRVTNTITVQAGARLELFTLNQFVMPLQTKPVQLNNGTLAGNGNFPAEGSTFGGPVTLASGTNFVQAIADTTLELLGPIGGSGNLFENSSAAGTVLLGGTNTYTGRTVVQSGILALENNASIANSSSILVNAGATFNVTVLATSPWTLGAAQTLGGGGTVSGNVLANGTVSPGSSIGTLNIAGDLTINGNLAIEVDKSQAQSNDVTVVSGALSNTGSGTLTVSNLGPTLVVGDTFTLFSQPVSGGGAITVTGGGATWTNNLAVDGSISVLTVAPTGPTNAEPITVSSTGGNLHLSWPTIGWRLQVQTNSLTTGLNTNWSTVANSTTTNAVNIPVSAGNPSVFFRLVYP